MSTGSQAGGARANSDNTSWSIYLRLLRYARPYTGTFLIGVLGGLTYWKASRRRTLLAAPLPLALAFDFPEWDAVPFND